MTQRNYTCLVAVGFCFMAIALGLILASLFTRSWLIYTRDFNANSAFDAGYWLLGPCSGDTCTGLKDAKIYRIACFALVIAASGLSGIGLLCLFIYLCATCCCSLSPWTTAMPKLNLICALFGSASAAAASALYLIGFYVIDGNYNGFNAQYNSFTSLTFSGWVPGFSFYLACVAAIFMFISGTVAFGARNATRVEAISSPQAIVVNNVVSQSSSSYQPHPQQYNPYPSRPGPW